MATVIGILQATQDLLNYLVFTQAHLSANTAWMFNWLYSSLPWT